MSRPVLFVTNLVPPDRAGAFAALHERVGLELALFGGRSHHATGGVEDPGVPHRHVSQREVHALAASGRYRAPATAWIAAAGAAWAYVVPAVVIAVSAGGAASTGVQAIGLLIAGFIAHREVIG